MVSRFNKRVPSFKTENLAGGKAYAHAPKMELIVAVLTTFLDNKFYETGGERLDRIKALVQKVPHEFAAKLALVARNQFHMRSVSHVLVGELAKIHRGDSLVGNVVAKVAERPDDLLEIVAYLKKPIPKQVKRGIRHALLKFSPYQLAKYRGESKEVKMVDLFNLAHPNPKYASKEQKKAWKELMKGELKSEETWEARLSAGEDKKKVWKDMITKGELGYMALLRNLRNLEQQADAKTIKMAAERIADKEEVKKSKQLPFRFYNAYQNVSERVFLDAIGDALEHSLDNVPKFKGNTLIAVDASGSMNGDPIKKASIFAAALACSNHADMILYDTGVKEVKIISRSPVIQVAEGIQKSAMGGGTDTSLVFQYATQRRIEYERIVILSDNESWQDSVYSFWNGASSGGTQVHYEAYKKLGYSPTVYAIDIAGHGTKDVTGGKVYHLAGWSDALFDFMKWIEKENELVDFIEGYALD